MDARPPDPPTGEMWGLAGPQDGREWRTWTIKVCSECEDPACEAPSTPVDVVVVPLDDVREVLDG